MVVSTSCNCSSSIGIIRLEILGFLPIDRIQCISWAEDICRWLNKLKAQLAEPVKSTVMQYIDAIHVVADERGRKMMEKIWKYYMSHLIIFMRE